MVRVAAGALRCSSSRRRRAVRHQLMSAKDDSRTLPLSLVTGLGDACSNKHGAHSRDQVWIGLALGLLASRDVAADKLHPGVGKDVSEADDDGSPWAQTALSVVRAAERF